MPKQPRSLEVARRCITVVAVVLSHTFVPYSNPNAAEEVIKTSVLYLFIERWRDGGNIYLGVSDLVYPIFDIMDGERKLVAILKCFCCNSCGHATHYEPYP